MPTFKKNDRVEFNNKSEIIYGTVRKSGADRCEVIKDGAKYTYKVPNTLLRPSQEPLPTLPANPMDVWGIRKYREIKASSEETTCFSAEITYEGKPVIYAENSGKGGCDLYRPTNGEYKTVAQFEADAKKWVIDHGMPEKNYLEAANMWIVWKNERAPYGGSPEDFIAEWKEALNIEDEVPSIKM